VGDRQPRRPERVLTATGTTRAFTFPIDLRRGRDRHRRDDLLPDRLRRLQLAEERPGHHVWGDYLWPSIVIQDPAKTTISAGVQQFVGSFGLSLSGGGAVFSAFIIATFPLFILVGFTMRYFVSGLTEGALKL
jgi:hypothetical protein